jgi:polar amino acid transport system substrate-binding protein
MLIGYGVGSPYAEIDMKKLLLNAVIGAWSVVAGLAVVAAPASAEVIIMAADVWCPYNCQPGAERPGFAIEMAKAILEPQGRKVEYAVIPWARTLEEVRAGKIAIAIGAGPSDNRGLRFGKESIGAPANVLIVRKGESFAYTGPESLKGKRLGAIRDYTYDEKLDAYIAANPQGDAVQLTSGEDAVQQNLRKLLGGRVDAVVESTDVTKYTLAQLGLTDKVEILPQGEASPVYLAVSAQWPNAEALIEALDKGVAQMRADGRLAAILAKYGVSDWATGS